MRKIWWLPVICIAAGAVQALFAADDPSPPVRKGLFGSRSRLLIYSKNKTKVPNPDAVKDDGPVTARAKVSDDVADLAPDTTRRAPLGQTGTVSPTAKTPAVKSYTTEPRPAAVPVASKQRNLITPGTAKIPETRTPIAKSELDLLGEEDDLLPQTDDATVRKLFEDIQPAIPPKKQPVAQSAARPEATARQALETESLTADPFVTEQPVAKSRDLSTPSLPTTPSLQARKSARYKELLESVQPGEDRPATALTSEKKVQNKIQPVSGHEPTGSDFEVNPFEPSERPSKVINAGLTEDAGNAAQRRVLPASATSTAKTTPGKIPAAKTPVAKMPETKKPTSSTTSLTNKPTTTVKTVAASTSAPAANNQAPQVDVKWEARGEVTLGEQCQCVLIVKNNGKVSAKDIIVEASFPESVRLVESVPFPKSSSSKLEWQFANLAAGEQKTIELTMVPTKRGELAASAQVRFTGTAATSFQVSEPMLKATVKMANEVNLGEPAAATVTISNPGTGTAQNVVIQAFLPSGLESTSGKEFSTDIGPLGPGETRTVRLSMIATAGGEQSVKVIAKSSTANLEQATQAEINVLAPSLKLAATGPSLRYMHRAAKYVLTATNNSNTSTENVRISQVVAAGFDFVTANHGGRWDSQARTVSWYIGHLDVGQATTVELELMPQKVGEFKHAFRVTGDAGIEATTVVATRVEGAASLVMEVKDTDDPVEVGSEMTYEIRVRNEGSKSAQKVAVSCELPQDVELLKVDGPTSHIVESGMLIFKPSAELAARDSLIYKVTIKATVAGSTRLRARLTSESIQKPLIVEEATQFYAE